MPNILCLDYGTKYIGLAISDQTETIADELTTLPNNPEIFENLKHILEHYTINTLVVGLPLHEDNQESTLVPLIKQFINQLVAENQALQVIYFDEFGTSQLAEQALVGRKKKKLRNRDLKKRTNQKAAQILLQSYLDQKKHI